MEKQVYQKIAEVIDEKIVQWKKCNWCWEEFPIYETVKELEEKFDHPKNNLCLSCMMRKLMAFRNQRKFHKSKDVNWKLLISMIAPEMNIKIISSQKEAEIENIVKEDLDYENIKSEEDLKKQFYDLFQNICWPNLYNAYNENADFANFAAYVKNVYLSSVVYNNSENVYYSDTVFNGKYIADSWWVYGSQIIYGCLNVKNSYKIFYSVNIKECSDVYFSNSLVNCSSCILCNNLNWKKYCYKNKQYTKEEYQKLEKEFFDKMKTYTGYKQILEEFNSLLENGIFVSLDLQNVEKTVWNIWVNSKNSIFSFEFYETDSCYNCWGEESKNCLNYIWWFCENVTNSCRIWWSNNVVASLNVLNSSDVFHSINIFSWKNVYFSIWIKNKENIILNRQLSKDEYNKIHRHIKNILKNTQKWWEFFPVILSPFPYNDTVANDYYPIKTQFIVRWEINNQIDDLFKDWYVEWEKAQRIRSFIQSLNFQEELLNKYWKWTVYILEPDNFISKAILDLGWDQLIAIRWRTKEKEINVPEWIELIKAEDLPDNIEDLTDQIEQKILKWAIICEKSWRPFRIIKPELEFYKKYNLPLPRKHPDIRYAERLEKRPKRNLYVRNCSKCNKEIISIYPINTQFKVYCQECYDKEVY